PDPSAAPAPGNVSGRPRAVVPAVGSVLPTVVRAGDRTTTRLRGAAIEVVDLLDTDRGLPVGDAAGLGTAAVDAGQLIATWDGQETTVVLARIVRLDTIAPRAPLPAVLRCRMRPDAFTVSRP